MDNGSTRFAHDPSIICRAFKVNKKCGGLRPTTLFFYCAPASSSFYNKIKTKINTPLESWNNKKLNPFQFSKFDREFPIERIFVVANEGEDCDGKTRDSEDIALIAETILLGEYDILDLYLLEQVLDEQRLAVSGLLLEETAVELGCNAGSQGVIFTQVGCLDGERTINLKLVGCQTSEIYWSCMGIGATPFETIKKIKEELSN